MNVPTQPQKPANGNAKWNLAFWIMVVICTTILPGIVWGVIQNDRLRATEDDKIRDRIEYLVEKNNAQFYMIGRSLAGIEAKLGVRTG